MRCLRIVACQARYRRRVLLFGFFSPPKGGKKPKYPPPRWNGAKKPPKIDEKSPFLAMRSALFRCCSVAVGTVIHSAFRALSLPYFATHSPSRDESLVASRYHSCRPYFPVTALGPARIC